MANPAGFSEVANVVTEALGGGDRLVVVNQLHGQRRGGRTRDARPVDDVDKDAVVAEPTGDGLGLLRQFHATSERGAVVQLGRQRGEKASPFGAVVGRKCGQGGFEHLDLLGVDLPQAGEPAAAVLERRQGQVLGVVRLSGGPGRVEEGGARVGDAGLALGGAEPDEQGDPGARRRLALGRELEGLGEVVDRLVRRECLERGLSGPAGVVDRLGGVGRPGGEHEVAGQLAQTPRISSSVERFERLSHDTVQTRPAGGTEVLVEGVADEGVREAEVPGGVG